MIMVVGKDRTGQLNCRYEDFSSSVIYHTAELICFSFHFYHCPITDALRAVRRRWTLDLIPGADNAILMAAQMSRNR